MQTYVSPSIILLQLHVRVTYIPSHWFLPSEFVARCAAYCPALLSCLQPAGVLDECYVHIGEPVIRELEDQTISHAPVAYQLSLLQAQVFSGLPLQTIVFCYNSK